jgi:hypothetical protein
MEFFFAQSTVNFFLDRGLHHHQYIGTSGWWFGAGCRDNSAQLTPPPLHLFVGY